jgi:hypothetical protein
VEEDRRSGMPQDTKDGLVTTPSHIYAQSECHCALCNNCYTNSHNRNRVLLYYLFQENKSFGSKIPFAFILWCTGSCVEHREEDINKGIHKPDTHLCDRIWVTQFKVKFLKVVIKES